MVFLLFLRLSCVNTPDRRPHPAISRSATSVVAVSVPPMTIDFLAHLRTESARFAEVMRAAEPAARVPTCPEWDAADLLWHLAEVQLFWATIVRERLDDPTPAEQAKPERPGDYPALLTLFDEANAALLGALENTADDVPVWSWSEDASVGFVRRRMAQEALVHRLDAELTVDAVTDLSPELATDGVHEVLRHIHGGFPPWSDYQANGPAGRLRTTDTGAEWTFQVGGFSGVSPNTGTSYANQPTVNLIDSGAPSFTVAATARDLDAWIWNRPTLADVAIDGNTADFEVFAAIIGKGVQ
jgi:uncharacterized protein (TIGR03083 family)